MNVEYVFKGRRFVLRTLARKLKAKGVPGASISNLSGIFKGRHNPSYVLLRGMAEILNMGLEEMDQLLIECRAQHKAHYDNPAPRLIED